MLILLLFLGWGHGGDRFESLKEHVPHEREMSMGELVVATGRLFLGKPYVAGSLDRGESEALVIDLDGLDCVTFTEYTVALAATVRRGGDYAYFRERVQALRYRDATVSGYCSRLHYTTDWARDNQSKGLLRDVTAEIGGEPFRKQINFMTEHTDAYPHLRDNPKRIETLRDVEQRLNSHTSSYIPKERIREIESKLTDGDIIAITTSLKGLDVAHMGITVFVAGRAHLLHASSTNNKVEISAQPLAEYLAPQASRTGIMVLRPLEP